MRRICLVALVAMLSMAACGPSGTTPTPSPVGGGVDVTPEPAPGSTATATAVPTPGSNTGGGGQVVITGAGVTVTLTSDVRCDNSATYGMTVFAGSQARGEGQPDGIALTIPPDPSLNAIISGSLGGRLFALGPDARGTVVNGNSGTWSGRDILGSNSLFSGSFTCP